MDTFFVVDQCYTTGKGWQKNHMKPRKGMQKSQEKIKLKRNTTLKWKRNKTGKEGEENNMRRKKVSKNNTYKVRKERHTPS